MMKDKQKSPKRSDKQAQIDELTGDLQRLRADFENYRKQAEREKSVAREIGAEQMTIKMLPVIDNIERAILHIPVDIAEHQWVKGIGSLIKQLDSTVAGLGVKRIDARPGTIFDPEFHQAVQFDEESEGSQEVVGEELQAGYMLNDRVIRHAMVRVKRSETTATEKTN